MKLPAFVDPQEQEERLMTAITSLECPELEERFRAVYDAAKYVHDRIKSDPGEFRGFVAGLTHTVQILIRLTE